MRMTLNLPDTIIDEAVKLSGSTNKTAVIVNALEDFIKRKKREELKKLVGTDLFQKDFDPLALRELEIGLFNTEGGSRRKDRKAVPLKPT